jgi:hypothetical protein
MAMAEREASGAGSDAASRCNARTDALSPLLDERIAFPEPQDHEKYVIYRAIRCRDIEQVRNLLDGGLDPNASLNPNASQTGPGLAYWAATAGSIPILKLLLERGAKIDGEEGSLVPGPLYGSISHTMGTDDWSVYEFLLSQGADPEIRGGNPTLTTAGHLAMMAKFGKINELLDQGYDRDIVELRHWVMQTLDVTTEDRVQEGKSLLERLDALIKIESSKSKLVIEITELR